jgi:PhnB protein
MGDVWATRIESYHMAKKSKKAKKSKPKQAKVNPVPKGFSTITPYLSIDGAATAIDWYKKAFGAKEIYREPTPDGKLMHAQIKIGDSIVMLSDIFPGPNAPSLNAGARSPVTLHIYMKNVDKLWQQAIDAGAKAVMPLDNMFWGERYGQLTDPFGHAWSIAEQVKMSKAERDEKQKQTMAMFSQGQHPEAPEQATPAQ